VLDQFRFHMTLTGRLPKTDLDLWQRRIAEVLPPVSSPYVLGSIALVGERVEDGKFQCIQSFTLSGPTDL
jgi:hypothetical protein